jgi:hypothetical protein
MGKQKTAAARICIPDPYGDRQNWSGKDRIRTPPENTGKTGVSDQSSAESGALDPQNAILDPELAAVVEAWPALPEAIRAGILAMIRAAG